MVRETVPSQQLQYHTTSKWIKTTASSPLEKFASDRLNQNGDLSQRLGSNNRNSCRCVQCSLWQFFPYINTSLWLHLPGGTTALNDKSMSCASKVLDTSRSASSIPTLQKARTHLLAGRTHFSVLDTTWTILTAVLRRLGLTIYVPAANLATWPSAGKISACLLVEAEFGGAARNQMDSCKWMGAKSRYRIT